MKKTGIKKGLLVLGLVLMVATMYMVFLYVPTEKTMGIVQRIFYLMVPMGWLAMLSFVIIFISSILYLKTREAKWDVLGYCAGELGFVFTFLTLFTGSMWAKPIWGVWWTWEPRLTATLVLWAIYIAYFMVRAFAAEEHRGATFAAVVGIIGFIDIPIIGLATTLWRTIHPGPIMFQEGGLDPSMVRALIVSLFAFTALFAVLLMERVSLKNGENSVKGLRKLLD